MLLLSLDVLRILLVPLFVGLVPITCAPLLHSSTLPLVSRPAPGGLKVSRVTESSSRLRTSTVTPKNSADAVKRSARAAGTLHQAFEK